MLKLKIACFLGRAEAIHLIILGIAVGMYRFRGRSSPACRSPCSTAPSVELT
jgi:hypothetical protein